MLPSVSISSSGVDRSTAEPTSSEATPAETLQSQFSGYGSTPKIVARCLDKLALKEPLPEWSDETVAKVVNTFADEKFPTIIALNKIDHPDSDKNIAKIAKAHPPEKLVLTSAISEVFLRRMAKQGYIKYVEGSDYFDTRDDLIDEGQEDGGGLKELDEKLRTRLDNLKDLVLYRFGSTGVVQVLQRAADLLGLIPVFPIRNIHFTTSREPVFRDCILVKK
jgi:ribosome-binding ATPase